MSDTTRTNAQKVAYIRKTLAKSLVEKSAPGLLDMHRRGLLLEEDEMLHHLYLAAQATRTGLLSSAEIALEEKENGHDAGEAPGAPALVPYGVNPHPYHEGDDDDEEDDG